MEVLLGASQVLRTRLQHFTDWDAKVHVLDENVNEFLSVDRVHHDG